MMPPNLGPGDVHLYLCPYQGGGSAARLPGLLAPYLNIAPASVALVRSPGGRLELADDRLPLRFNASHSGGRLLVAVTQSGLLGVDLEFQRSRPRLLEIARRYFAVSELADLEALPESQRAAHFYRLWTAKEALVKALGRGLAFGLARMALDLQQNQPRLHSLDPEAGAISAWQLAAAEPEPGWTACVALRDADAPLKISWPGLGH